MTHVRKPSDTLRVALGHAASSSGDDDEEAVTFTHEGGETSTWSPDHAKLLYLVSLYGNAAKAPGEHEVSYVSLIFFLCAAAVRIPT
jgi:hypothetical protein